MTEPTSLSVAGEAPAAQTLAKWLSGLSREQLVHHVAQGVGWVYLTRDARKQTAMMMAEAIVCYLEEKCDGKN